jgi:hypothetical protein
MGNGSKKIVEMLATFEYSQGNISIEIESITLIYRQNSGYPWYGKINKTYYLTKYILIHLLTLTFYLNKIKGWKIIKWDSDFSWLKITLLKSFPELCNGKWCESVYCQGIHWIWWFISVRLRFLGYMCK